MTNVEQYLNRDKNTCVALPKKVSACLQVDNFLSEYDTDEERELAMLNLLLLDKVPTKGSTKLINSGDIFTALLNIDNNLNNTYSYLNNILNNKANSNDVLNIVLDLLNTISNIRTDLDNLSSFISDNYITMKYFYYIVNRIWNKISDITGEILLGIDMTVIPSYFTGNDCNINISAISSGCTGIFEKILFFKREINTSEWISIEDIASNVESFTTSTTISNTTDIKCEATILGIPYELIKTIHNYKEFWIFTGQNLSNQDILNLTNTIPSDTSNNKYLRNSYYVHCNLNDYIYIVLGKSLSLNFIRADLNGVEILFINRIIKDLLDNEYVVYTSINSFNEGTYNIDING